jgi:hypothetical protein
VNKRAFEHAKRLIEKGSYVFDEKDMWSEHKPSAQEENEYIKKYNFDEYGKWYLGLDTDEKEDTKGLIAILPKYIDVECWLQKTGRDNISIMILKRQQHIYMT